MDLETRQLQHLLAQADQLPEVLMLKPVTTSTNDDVREVALKGVNSVLICSRKQTQGRGQQKRAWVSPEGNIYLSTLLNLQTPVDGRLSLEIALNILQMPSLEHYDLKVKWPNDLYFNNKKFGGILVEPINTYQVIVGVGINIAPIKDININQSITSLEEIGINPINRLNLIAELYLAIQQAGQWFSHNSYNLAARFNHHAAFINQSIEFQHQSIEFEHKTDSIHGKFLGIQNDGAIILETEDQVSAYYQGRMRLTDPTK